jgi:hypothetical protein
MLENAEIVK